MRALSASPAPRLAAAGSAARGPRARIVAAVAAARRRSCTPIPPSTSTLPLPHAAVCLCRRRRCVLASASSSSSSSSPEQEQPPSPPPAPLSPDDFVDGNSDEVALESAALRALLLCWFATQVSVFLDRLIRWLRRFPPTNFFFFFFFNLDTSFSFPFYLILFFFPSYQKKNPHQRSAPSSPRDASWRPASPSTAEACPPPRPNQLSRSHASPRAALSFLKMRSSCSLRGSD